jgi:hypothetical protein
VPSAAATVSRFRPTAPWKLNSLTLAAGANGDVRLAWYPPKNALSAQVFVRRAVYRGSWTPVLFYRVTCSNGSLYHFGGHNRVIVTNHGGRGIGVIGNLTPGKTYTFTVQAVGPLAAGPGRTRTARIP